MKESSHSKQAPEHGAARVLDALLHRGNGAVRWEDFMHAALYDPGHGYYTSQVKEVGARGDFSTSATLDGTLARALAAWSRAGGVKDIIELGGGNGALASDLLRARGLFASLTTKYHFVEISEGLRHAQRRRLSGLRLRRTCWHESIEDAVQASGPRCAVFGNEFIDAFPCIPLRHEMFSGWRELQVEAVQGGLRLAWASLSERADLALANSGAASLPPGTCCEIHLSFREWLSSLSTTHFTGPLLLIDYGGVDPQLYERRPNGTLRGYFAQQCIQGAQLLHRFGRQDLTADVNFLDIQLWATQLGWSASAFESQADFLNKWTNPRASRLAAAEGVGGAFQVIELRRPCKPMQVALCD